MSSTSEGNRGGGGGGGDGRGGRGGGRKRHRGRGRGGGGGRSSKNEPQSAAGSPSQQQQQQQQQQGESQKSKRGGDGNRKPRQRGGRGRANKNAAGGAAGGAATADTKAPAPSSPEELQRQEEARVEREAKEEAEREAKAEAAAKRQAEAARKSAVAARAREQEERDAKLSEALALLRSTSDVAVQHAESRARFIEPGSLAAARKEFEANKKRLKTDLKKCTTFVKKIKSGSAWSMKPADIRKDVASFNLSRYVEEVVAAVVESKPKVADIPVVAALCCAMHERYDAFLSALGPELWGHVKAKPTNPEAAKMRRVYVRLLVEFLLMGLVQETKPYQKCVEEATGAKDGSYTVQDANLVVAVCRAAGFEIFGIVARSVQDAMALVREEKRLLDESADASPADAEASKDTEGVAVADEVPTVDEGPVVVSSSLLNKALDVSDKLEGLLKNRAVPTTVTDSFVKMCIGAYNFLSASLVQTHNKLQKLEKRCEHDRLLSGTLPEAREKGLADARKLRESLLKSVEALSDVLDQPMPQLQEDDVDAGQEAGVGVEVWTKEGGGADDDFGPFDDEETRAFYCDIPDLLTTFPPALLGMTPEAIEKRKAENMKKYGADADADDVVGDDDAANEVTPVSEAELDEEEQGTGLSIAEDDMKLEDDENAGDTDKDAPHYRLKVLLEEELPECHNRMQIDELTEKFCSNHGSSKNSRKRLAKALFNVPRARLDLLPFYSRMTATLDRVWPDIAPPLVKELEQQFHGQAKYKKNQNIDSRMKTARYIGEVTKFRVAPPIVFLRCLGRCLDDFTGPNVDVACCLLESSGRYVYRLKHTNQRIAGLMESMTRLSKAKNFDERLQSQLKAAFFSVKPPPSGPRKAAKVYSPLESYLRHLLLVRLEPTEASVSFVTKQLVRFPWSDPSEQCGSMVCRIMLKACRKGRYKTIQAIASIAASLRLHRSAGEVPVRLTDAVIEELRWAVERPNFRDQQRTITYARLLGELYCSCQVAAAVIFAQLYEFINLGHEIPDSLRYASKKLTEASTGDTPISQSQQQSLPVLSHVAVSQTIAEDEEMEDAALEEAATDDAELDQAPPPPQPVAVSQYSKYDPRVPSVVDPPNSSYRVKLVCTLLEVVGSSIVSRNNLPRVKGFLAAFQRYLFTKTMLPAEVEFALLDTFDILDSKWRRMAASGPSRRGGAGSNELAEDENGFPRYTSWLDSHNATVAVEESEALFEADKRARLEALADMSQAMTEVENPIDGHFILNDEDSMIDDEEDASLSVSAKDSIAEETVEDELEPDADGHEDEDESHEGGGSAGEDSDSEGESGEDGDEDEFDEEGYVRQLEEEAFERELRQITMDALEKGKSASRKLVADNMPSGTQIIKKRPGESKEPDHDAATASSPPSMPFGGKSGISLQLLKKGTKGKMEATELVVPLDTNLAMVATKQDDEAARERDVIKQRVLQYEAHSAEADVTGGNVYLEQEKLQVIRNRPLMMDDIDRNFGTTGGSLPQSQQPRQAGAGPGSASASSGGRSQPHHHGLSTSSGGRGTSGRGLSGRGGPGSRGGGRGRGRSSSGRTLFR